MMRTRKALPRPACAECGMESRLPNVLSQWKLREAVSQAQEFSASCKKDVYAHLASRGRLLLHMGALVGPQQPLSVNMAAGSPSLFCTCAGSPSLSAFSAPLSLLCTCAVRLPRPARAETAAGMCRSSCMRVLCLTE